MFWYGYYVKYWDEVDCELREVRGFDKAKKLRDAISNLSDYFGEDNIDKVEIEFLGERDTLFLVNDEYLFGRIKRSLNNEVAGDA